MTYGLYATLKKKFPADFASTENTLGLEIFSVKHMENDSRTGRENNGEKRRRRSEFSVSTIFLCGLCILLGSGLTIFVIAFADELKFHSTMAMISAVAGVALLALTLLAIVRWIWRERNFGNLNGFRHIAKKVISRPADRNLEDHYSEITNEYGDQIARTLMIFLGLSAGTSLLTSVVVGLFSFATFLAHHAQIEVIDRQNRMTEIDQKFEFSRSIADQKYREISDILLDSQAGVGEQIYAIDQIPTVMVAQVVEHAPTGEGLSKSVDYVIRFPNFNRTRNLVRSILKTDRVTSRLRQHGVDWQGYQFISDSGLARLTHLKNLSESMLSLIENLGPVNDESFYNPDNFSLWNWKPKSFYVPEALKDPHNPPEANRSRYPTGRLAHIENLDFFQAAFFSPLQKGRWQQDATEGGYRLDLTGVSICYAILPCCDFSFAYLNNACFVDSCLQHSDFQRSSIKNVDFAGANVLGANFNESYLDGSSLLAANFSSASMVGASLEEAHLERVLFYGTDLRSVDLSYCFVLNSHFVSTNLNGASMRGARILLSEFAGATMTGVDLVGANLSGSFFGPKKIYGSFAKFTTLGFDGRKLSPLWINETLSRNDSKEIEIPGAIIDDIKIQENGRNWIRLLDKQYWDESEEAIVFTSFEGCWMSLETRDLLLKSLEMFDYKDLSSEIGFEDALMSIRSELEGITEETTLIPEVESALNWEEWEKRRQWDFFHATTDE